MKDKIKYGILLAAIGDMIGFGNGVTEFNGGSDFTEDNYGDKYEQIGSSYSDELVFNFIHNGGVEIHPKENYVVSDDTLMLLANFNALNSWSGTGTDDISTLIPFIISSYLELIKTKDSLEKFETIRGGGRTTINYLKKLQNGYDYLGYEYDSRAGGSGGTMRSGAFGVWFHRPEHRLLLIEAAIESTCLTHPNAIAYLGSVTVALFASYAVQGIPIERWHNLMLEVLESRVIDDYVLRTREKSYPFYHSDKRLFISKWKDYVEDKFGENNSYKKTQIMKYPSKRSMYYNKFSSKKLCIYPGAGGDDSVIIAYDCLLNCESSWSNLVSTSMLHVGDSDTTGCIAGLLYGLYYGGTGSVIDMMIQNMNDHKQECIEMIEKTYKTLLK